MDIKLTAIQIEKPEPINFILGQTHFIKSVEDIHEALVSAVPGIKFGLAFCEASGKCLVRWTGTDPAMIELARKNALAIAAGHSFIVFLGEGFYPVNVLNAIKMVPEVCRIFCATRQPDAGARCRNRPGARHPGRGGRFLRPRASKLRPTSPGARTSCARSATSSKGAAVSRAATIRRRRPTMG